MPTLSPKILKISKPGLHMCLNQPQTQQDNIPWPTIITIKISNVMPLNTLISPYLSIIEYNKLGT